MDTTALLNLLTAVSAPCKHKIEFNPREPGETTLAYIRRNCCGHVADYIDAGDFRDWPIVLAFRSSCPEILQWAISLQAVHGPYNISRDENILFKIAVERKFVEGLQWLQEREEIVGRLDISQITLTQAVGAAIFQKSSILPLLIKMEATHLPAGRRLRIHKLLGMISSACDLGDVSILQTFIQLSRERDRVINFPNSNYKCYRRAWNRGHFDICREIVSYETSVGRTFPAYLSELFPLPVTAEPVPVDEL